MAITNHSHSKETITKMAMDELNVHRNNKTMTTAVITPIATTYRFRLAMLPTYGEAVRIQKESMFLVKGKWVMDELVEYREFKTKDEAMAYFCEKLDNYWLSQLTPSLKISKERKLEILKGRGVL